MQRYNGGYVAMMHITIVDVRRPYGKGRAAARALKPYYAYYACSHYSRIFQRAARYGYGRPYAGTCNRAVRQLACRVAG